LIHIETLLYNKINKNKNLNVPTNRVRKGITMNLKKEHQKQLKSEKLEEMLKDLKEGTISKQIAIVTLYTSGKTVTEILKIFNECEVKMIYNHIYNVISKKWTKNQHDNVKTTTTKSYF